MSSCFSEKILAKFVLYAIYLYIDVLTHFWSKMAKTLDLTIFDMTSVMSQSRHTWGCWYFFGINDYKITFRPRDKQWVCVG